MYNCEIRCSRILHFGVAGRLVISGCDRQGDRCILGVADKETGVFWV